MHNIQTLSNCNLFCCIFAACKIHLSKTTADILTEVGGYVIKERDDFPDKVNVGQIIIIDSEPGKSLFEIRSLKELQ
jgi:hypothetical protein